MRSTLQLTLVMSVLAGAATQALTAPRPARAAATTQIYWGGLVSGSVYGQPDPQLGTLQAVDTFSSHVGKSASILHIGRSWYSSGVANNFPTQQMETVRLHGQITLYRWSSVDSAAPVKADRPAFRASTIADGAYDAYIRQFATDARN